jgi:type VI secretion system FHA domain protein
MPNMPLQLEIVSQQRELVGDDAVCLFREEGGTIGRSSQNDWIIPDPDRYISSRHATIDYKGGSYYLVDTSTNGVFVNGDCEPVGKGNPRRLFNGDQLRLGDIEIVVSIDTGESIQVPAAPPRSQVAAHHFGMVEEEAHKTGLPLLDEEELTGDAAFRSALRDEAADSEDEATPDPAANQSEPELDPEPETAPAPPEHPAPVESTSPDLLHEFLSGLGIDPSELHPAVDKTELIHNAGAVLREFVDGVTELLTSRANLKNTFELDQTTALPRHNNPIKLSARTRDSLLQLLIGKDGEYLGPRDAVREVCRDLLFHQDAMLESMRAAFTLFADCLAPAELQRDFDRSLDGNVMTKLMNKSRYWDLYVETYSALTDKGEAAFPNLFADEFVRAYERQVAELRRGGGTGEQLKATVVLEGEKRLPGAATQLDRQRLKDFATTLATDEPTNNDFAATRKLQR